MKRLFKKKSVRNFKRLNMVPIQYNHCNLEPLKPSLTEKNQLFVKRKSTGLTSYKNLNFQFELTEYQDNSSSMLVLTSSLVREMQLKDLTNHYVDILGIDENYMTKFNSTELDLLEANDEIAFKTWEIRAGRTHHSLSIYVKRASNQYQIEVNSIIHDV